MTDFHDGDILHGQYGLKKTRRNGRWYSDSGSEYTSISDDTAEWLSGLSIQYPAPSSPTGSRKISKSDPTTTPTYIYNYWIECGRKDLHANP